MKNNRIFCLALVVVLALCSFSVGFAEAEKDIKIGICLSDHTHTTFIHMLEAAREYAAENGHITLIEQDGKSDVASVLAALENFINSGCDAIVFQNSYPEALASTVAEAVELGVCVLAYDSPDKNATFNYISDQETIGLAIGHMAGKWINENADGKGKACILGYDSFSFLKERADWIEKGILEVSPDSEIVARQDCVKIADGYDIGEVFLQSNPEINCYAGIIDSGSVGVNEAYVDSNFEGTVGMFGCDCTEEALAAMAKDKSFFEGTVSFELPKQMINMIKIVHDYCSTGAVPEGGNTIVMQSVEVTKDNYKEFQ